MGLGKDLQTLLVELWTIEPVEVQELFPLPASRLVEQLGGRKLLHKAPARTGRPIIKSLQRRRIILMQDRLKLVHQLRAFADELDFIPTQQPQLVDQWVQRL